MGGSLLMIGSCGPPGDVPITKGGELISATDSSCESVFLVLANVPRSTGHLCFRVKSHLPPENHTGHPF